MTNPETRSDSVFDLDEELPGIQLRGKSLNKYGIEDGVLEEPSDTALHRWRRLFYASARAERPDLPEDATPEQIAEAFFTRDWEVVSALEVDAFAVLCGAKEPPRSRPQPPVRGEKTTEAHWQKKQDEHAEDVEKYEAEWDGGYPTRAQLAGLPPRGKAKLFGYLAGKFMNPTGAGSDTNG